MISTSITGESASNQLMDLLAVVANPNVYKAKLDALDAATAENKKYVEALGPASEIVQLRDQAKALREAAAEYTKSATAKADAGLEAASQKANAIVAAAQARADGLTVSAEATKAQTDALMAEAQAELATAKKATAGAVKAQASAKAREQELTQALESAVAAKAEADAAKADILAKHQAFVQGL